MVAAELRSAPHARGIQLLAIRNYGPSLARNVQVSFDPPIPDPTPEQMPSITPFLKRRYAEPIPVLTPGVELDNIWFSGVLNTSGQWENAEPTPDRCIVTIAYEDTSGNNSYVDAIPIDVGLIRARTYATSPNQPDEQLKKAIKHLGRIEGALLKIARSLPDQNEPRTGGAPQSD
jgi:hypothetical protein